MLAVMLVSAASILLIPFIDSLWLIVVVLASRVRPARPAAR